MGAAPVNNPHVSIRVSPMGSGDLAAVQQQYESSIRRENEARDTATRQAAEESKEREREQREREQASREAQLDAAEEAYYSGGGGE